MEKILEYDAFLAERRMKEKVVVSAGIVITYKNKILLLHPKKFSEGDYWTIPKGGVDKGEKIWKAAIRETFEECGIKIPKESIKNQKPAFVNYINSKGRLKKVYWYQYTIKNLDDIGLEGLEIPKKQLQDKEIDEGRFVSKKKAYQIMDSRMSSLLDFVIF